MLRQRERATSTGVRVLVAERAPSHAVAYVDQFGGDDSAGSAPTGVDYQYRANLSGDLDADVIHLAAIDSVIGGPKTPEHVRRRRAAALVKSLKRDRIALVRTVFGGTVSTSPAHAIVDGATTSFVVLSPTTRTPDARRTHLVPHSHLRDRFLGYPRSTTVPGRIVFASPRTLDRAYEGPLKVFAQAGLPGYTLRIVGSVPAPLTMSFQRTIGRYPDKISLQDGPNSDALRVQEISRAELVVVGAPDSYDALSTVMLALSLDRPVLIEDTAGTRSLADEVGHEWVHLHPGRLTADSLAAATAHLRHMPPTGRPNLDARAPNRIADQYASVFREAAAAASSPPQK
ncbi:MAG: hypothetical protein QM622_06455 [Microbacterium sp.]